MSMRPSPCCGWHPDPAAVHDAGPGGLGHRGGRTPCGGGQWQVRNAGIATAPCRHTLQRRRRGMYCRCATQEITVCSEEASRGRQLGLGGNQPFLQNCFVMRHGERFDTEDAKWHETAERPYDPPLSDSGRNRAMGFGFTMKREQWNVARIVCSPFLRCVQTAAEVVKALCSDDAGEGDSCSSDIKVCIDCGIGEVMNSRILRVCPKFPVSALDMSVLLDVFPAQMRDYSFDPFLRKLTPMEESTEDAHARCIKAINHAANCFPCENILFVTHGDAVAAAAMEIGELYVYGVEYCGYLHGRRLIYSVPPEPLVSEKWDLLLDDVKYGLSWL